MANCSYHRGTEDTEKGQPLVKRLAVLRVLCASVVMPSEPGEPEPQMRMPTEIGILDWNPVVWYRDSTNISCPRRWKE